MKIAKSDSELAARLLDKAIKSGADKAETIIINSVNSSVTARFDKVEGLERADSKGLGIRVFIGNSQASVSTNDYSKDSLDSIVEKVIAMVKIVPPDIYSDLAKESEFAKDVKDLNIIDSKEPTTEEMLIIAKSCEASALEVKGISNSEGADFSYSRYEVNLHTSNGFAGGYSGTSYGLSVSVIAEQNGAMERDYEYTSARHFAGLSNPEDLGRKAANNTLKRLGGRKIKTCNAPVIFERRVARSLLASLASAISGASIARKTSFLQGKMGEALFRKGVNIIDDPFMIAGHGSRPIDGEGVAGAKRAVIEEGRLTTWLLDIRSANQLGLKTTGHAVRSLSSPPSPSSSNFYLENGQASLSELLSDIKDGFLVNRTFGMGVNLITGDYSQGASGFWVENGEITYPVNEVTIAGNLLEMFANAVPANDLLFESSTSSPSLLLGKMMIAGS